MEVTQVRSEGDWRFYSCAVGMDNAASSCYRAVIYNSCNNYYIKLLSEVSLEEKLPIGFAGGQR